MTRAEGDTSGPSTVIAGHSASEDARERAYAPAIHPLPQKSSYEKDGPAGDVDEDTYSS
jgi:hypothetical protein